MAGGCNIGEQLLDGGSRCTALFQKTGYSVECY